jgi:cysteine desulfurase
VIYLDHHALVPVSAAVRSAILAAYAESLGNPASVHRAGQRARARLEAARANVAASIGASAADLVFAGSGSEACNLGVLGLLRPRLRAGHRRIVASRLEHPAVTEALRMLVGEGAECVDLPITAGIPATGAELCTLLDGDPAGVVVQWVNHETGLRFPIEAYAAACAERGIPLVVDGSQALGKLPIDVRRVPVSALVLSSAKVGGPAGVSAVFHARCEPMEAVVVGGGQERGLRPGTPDVAALTGFGEAARLVPLMLAQVDRTAELRTQLEAGLVQLGALVNGAESERVCSVTNVSFPGRRSDVLVAALDVEGLCVSAGAACSSGLSSPSPVLRALYAGDPGRAESALRFSLGTDTTAEDIEGALAIVARVLSRIRTRP